jgi:hypothetical protein
MGVGPAGLTGLSRLLGRARKKRKAGEIAGPRERRKGREKDLLAGLFRKKKEKGRERGLKFFMIFKTTLHHTKTMQDNYNAQTLVALKLFNFLKYLKPQIYLIFCLVLIKLKIEHHVAYLVLLVMEFWVLYKPN